MTVALQKIVEEIKVLQPDERRQLKAVLASFDEPSPEVMTEEKFAQHLAAKGIVTLPTGTLGPARPVQVTGKPISELIIGERG